ncbi:BRCT domain-containing protein [bacterium endosymbiont of Bathymodiolus sp. 5 South]|uniref:BRCT domain-containing protein n=1 Tax=bacterium endosymbiont of Bathymodiolus sp. 5 South TaxID=1181670 RepID=UPI0010AF74D1|nr:helix-hairpin-helix domain-containing protein [bacterium endosymbiont of Bathymodiolus sp. 5 South]SSC08874.1 DNA ligase [bacterium endosymbiont of Bathymodiolus sp. 5 South]VVH62708.1 DNA ligase (NAD(+)) (EC [uncultured Gammaproteobacteria bacterium]VVM21122.1 DNA ligase (EC [uncultured Gammaproteobacteria bacterium]
MALTQAIRDKIIRQEILVDELSDQQLADFCITLNTAYRDGNPMVSDKDYDFIYLPALKKRRPEHPLLQAIEPEGAGFSTDKVLLPEIMLSTDKAYSQEEVGKWLERIKKSAIEIDVDIHTIQIKATPKLDGFAGYDDGIRLYTRGDGKKGSDISRVFERGLQVYKDTERGQGAGEIVVQKSYFEQYLSADFEYPRNFQASLIKEKALDEKTEQAIKNKAALFVPFNQLPHWLGSMEDLKTQFDIVVEDVLSEVDFDVDGVVFEVTNDDLKTHMGANRKFHRWQIAFKENKDKAQVKVLSVTPQVGRTGKITPVAELEPTLLSGATINRASAHHYGLVKEQGLGAGSVIELMRSGLVIPKINKVLKPTEPNIPTVCPSCGKTLQWESDFLICVNHSECPAQVIGKMEYFFKILGNNDGFGVATIKKLYENGIRKISEIYALTHNDLTKMGFGDKTSENLIAERHKSITEQIEDWRFLAAFGITRLGMGNCENLLRSCLLSDIFVLNLEKIADIEGFAELTAQAVVTGLQDIKNEFDLLNQYDFNLEITPLQNERIEFTHVLVGKKVVFTGKMNGSRDKMKKKAKSIGIKVLVSVSAKTDYLVVGDNVGQKKIAAAEKFNVAILTEENYLTMIR